MTNLNNAYTQRQQELHYAQQKSLRRMSYMTMLEWSLVALFILFAWGVYGIYGEYHAAFAQLSPVLQLSIGIVPLSIGILLISLTIFTDASRANTKQLLELSSLHFDVVIGVHTALNDYLGDKLPDYQKAMGGFGIGHELYQTAQGYSERLRRTIDLTRRAAELVDLKSPLGDIKDLPAQARLVLQNAKDVIMAFEEMPEHHEIEELCEKLEKLLGPNAIHAPNMAVAE